ncbi:MAG TPA: ABC transporter permease [Trebonia sp.]|jgi:peptide/nickel transport system permease protein|nr:ABC transporter permease [Trebonia sp.]
MWAYLLRRVLAGIIVLLVLSFGVFILVALSGNPLAALQATPGISRATIAAAGAQLHLNEPLVDRYWGWLVGLLHGSFGYSYTGQPVGPQIAQRLLVTVKLVVPAVILSVLLGVIVGVISAVRQYKPVDHVSTGLAYLFFSTPVFVLALLLKDFLAVDVNRAVGHTILFTVGESTPGITGAWNVFVDEVQHAVLPVITLTLVTYATWSRFQRAAMLDVLNADYIRLARAKGLSPRRVLFVHALRNALIPVVTVVAIDFAALIGGALVTEIVFSWDGMGQYLYNALTGAESPDVYAVSGWLMVAGTAVVVFNILADLVYGLLDPRIRYA